MSVSGNVGGTRLVSSFIPFLQGCQASESHTTGTKYFEIAVQTVWRGLEQTTSIPYLQISRNIINDMGMMEEHQWGVITD